MQTESQDWIEIKLRTSSAMADTVSDLLEQLGSLAVTYADAADSPILEPRPGERRLWPNTEVTGLFAQGTDPKPILQALQQILGDHIPMSALKLKDQNWIRAWMDSFHPMRFGRRLWICPSWAKVPDPEAVTVMLDPGLAFGTGTHPTTALCLTYLDSLELKDQDILDYGCGSGILAIAALKLGAKSAYGVDIDPQALIASRENALRNQVENKLEVSDKAPEKLFPVVVSNILAGPLTELEPVIAAHCAPGAYLALSGILSEQAEEVSAAYQRDFDLNPPQTREGWALITGRRH